jgi:hypothetical protein
MLRLWILLVLAAGLLVGCGGNDGQETGQVETEATSTTAQGNGSAGDVIVEYFTLLAAGDSLAGGDYFADEVMQSLGGEENFQAAQAMQRLQLEERGGLSGIVVIDEQVEGEQSMVTFEITTVGGTVDTGQALLVLREGEWKWIR